MLFTEFGLSLESGRQYLLRHSPLVSNNGDHTRYFAAFVIYLYKKREHTTKSAPSRTEIRSAMIRRTQKQRTRDFVEASAHIRDWVAFETEGNLQL